MADITPRLRMGVEYNRGRRWAYSLAFGAGNSFLNAHRLRGSTWGNRYSLYEIRPELKYEVYDGIEDLSIYVSSEWFYIYMRDELTNDHYRAEGSTFPSYYDKATFQKQKLGAHIKAGFRYRVSRKIELDFYGGIGIAYRKIEYKDVVNPVPGGYLLFIDWIPRVYRYAGESVIPHLALGFKAGWIL